MNRRDQKEALEALKEAIAAAGSQQALGDICGVSQQTVWEYVNKARSLPAFHCIAVEQHTGVSRHRLRPDLSRIFRVQ